MLSHVWLFAIPWIVACQAPLSLKFLRQELWNGLPFPSPGHLPNWGIEPGSPALQANFFFYGQSVGASASASVLPMNVQSFRIDGLWSLGCRRVVPFMLNETPHSLNIPINVNWWVANSCFCSLREPSRQWVECLHIHSGVSGPNPLLTPTQDAT